MENASSSRIVELLHAYLDADYRWELDGAWHRLRVGAAAPDIDTAFPEASRFALVSAWDPHSVVRGDAANREADAALHYLLSTGPYPYRAAFSSARDRTWREPSWLVIGMPVEALDALGRRFGQLGTLAWRRGEPVRLRMDAVAPPGEAERDCVDWLK